MKLKKQCLLLLVWIRVERGFYDKKEEEYFVLCAAAIQGKHHGLGIKRKFVKILYQEKTES